MERSVGRLKGVGPQKQKALEKMGIRSVGDLLTWYPRRYVDRNRQEDYFFQEGDLLTVFGQVVRQYQHFGRRRWLEVTIETQPARRILQLKFFHGTGWFAKSLTEGVEGLFSGRVSEFRGRWQMTHPDFEILTGNGSDEDSIHLGRIVPLYPTTDASRKNGLDSRGWRRLIHAALRIPDLKVPDFLPPEFVAKYKLSERREAFYQIHFPAEMDQAFAARKRFILEEFFLYHALMKEIVLGRRQLRRSREISSTLKPEYRLNVPFEYTGDQKRAIEKILGLAAQPWPYSALLQGDVGSGKTIVVAEIAMRYIQSDFQVAFLAPTEILARQQFEKVTALLENPLFPAEILVGQEKAAGRRQKLASLADGSTRLVFGTHALIQKDVKFRDLGLVIIDEQHRFGVEQREALMEKGVNPDLIALTATPIPRTLALSLYGNLESVVIQEKPAGRIPIDTKWFGEDRLPGIYNSLRKYLDQGRQAFLVYPLVDESEKMDLNSCVRDYEELAHREFRGYRCGLLHGKLKAAEKEAVMRSFRQGEIQLLFTTTVVEVGIDVPNATVMVIRHAERFGLSALHQLRGRVGRGSEKSFCILVSSEGLTEAGQRRLQAMTESGDGFYLSEVDLEIRGPGELLGIRQAGLPEFRVASLSRDRQLCETAYQAVVSLNEASTRQVAELAREYFGEGLKING